VQGPSLKKPRFCRLLSQSEINLKSQFEFCASAWAVAIGHAYIQA